MKTLFRLLLPLLLLVAACSEDPLPDPPPAPQPPKENLHTTMFVFIGTSLSDFFAENIEQARKAFTTQMARSNRIVMYGFINHKWQIAEIRHSASQGEAEITTLKECDDADRRNPEFFTRVVNQMKSLAPAHSYGLVMGGHGSGWLPKDKPLPMAVMSRRPMKDPWGGFYPVTRAFGERDTHFNVEDIAAQLSATGTRFDYLIFDDCFMSNIETLYAMRHNAQYIIASPCEVMGDGFPYKYVVPALMRDNSPLEARLHEVCRKYHHFYNNEYPVNYRSGCIALTVCSELEEMAAISRQIFTSPTRECRPEALQTYENCNNHMFYDFGQYVEQIATEEMMLRSFNEQFDRTFPKECRLHTAKFYSMINPSKQGMYPIDYYSGVTSSAPSTKYSEENRRTEWWAATH